MKDEDWTARVKAYRRQGRSDSDIREIAAQLQRRGPRQPRETPRGPRTPLSAEGTVTGGNADGMVRRADYLAKARCASLAHCPWVSSVG